MHEGYIGPHHQLSRHAESLDTPGRRLALCVVDTIVKFYVAAAEAHIEAITALVNGPAVPTSQKIGVPIMAQPVLRVPPTINLPRLTLPTHLMP